MKRFIIFLLVIATAVSAGYSIYRSGALSKYFQPNSSSKKAIYYCPMHPTYTSDRPGTCPICNMALVKKEETTNTPHQDSHQGHGDSVAPREVTVKELMNMKPGEICLLHKCKMGGQCLIAMTEEFARLGKCPHCGEDLGVIIRELLPNGYANVRLTSEKQQLIGIQTNVAKKMPMTKSIRTVGRIAYDPELYQAEEEYIQAVQAQKKAESGTIPEIKEQAAHLSDSARLKLKLKGLSEALIDEVEAAGKPDRSLLYSEAGGAVWLYASIYEYEIPIVKIGEKVNIETLSIPGKKFSGMIRSIDPVLDPTTRSVKIRAVLENPEGLLKPEMYVNVNLELNLGEVVAVPEEAVFKTGGENIVFVRKVDGLFEPREVTLGARSENFYEVKSGLAEGETVVTSGNFLIDSESRLKAALEGMGSGGGHQHGG